MQSSYNLIKKGSAKQGDNKVIATEYVGKNQIFEQNTNLKLILPNL